MFHSSVRIILVSFSIQALVCKFVASRTRKTSDVNNIILENIIMQSPPVDKIILLLKKY